MKMPAQHHHEPNPERPAVHGMLMVGEARVLLSHLPMFHAPHAQQIILEASLLAPSFDPKKKYVNDRNATQTRIYTWMPKPFVLSDLLASRPGPPTMVGTIFRGHSGGATWDTSGHEDHRTTIPVPRANDPLGHCQLGAGLGGEG